MWKPGIGRRGRRTTRATWLRVVTLLACAGCIGCGGGAPRPPADRPNILLVVVDTLRADRVQPAADGASMTPAIQRRIAARGALFERAYAAAPWTVPSMIGVMSGRHPGRHFAEDGSDGRLPHGVRTMAEVLRAHGYRTAAFTANPTLHEGNGFAQGFETFYTAPADRDSALLHAEDDLQPRVLRWLRNRDRGRPFFLWVQYLDPHDPYTAPTDGDLLDRLWPDAADEAPVARVVTESGESHPLTGGDVHGLYRGELQLEDERGVEAVRALYDAEVRYVDTVVDGLLEALGDDTLERTLVVLASDHGEELHERGGWKHGQTLYDEQIRVPLLLRWDGVVPAGRRFRVPVSLLDLLPTLAALVGAEVPSTDGVDLSPAILSGASLPERPVLARGLSSGPDRVATVMGDHKLVLFDRAARFRPGSPLEAHLWNLDVERMRRVELYDLRADPGELHDLSGRASARVGSLQARVHPLLDRQLAGLRIAATGVPPGSRLRVSVELDRAPPEWKSYFLAPGSRVRHEGRVLELDLEGGPVTTGIRLPHVEPGLVIEAVGASLDGRPLEETALRIGDVPHGDGPVPVERIRGSAWSPAVDGRLLQIWLPVGPEATSTPPDREHLRRLRALGYVQ